MNNDIQLSKNTFSVFQGSFIYIKGSYEFFEERGTWKRGWMWNWQDLKEALTETVGLKITDQKMESIFTVLGTETKQHIVIWSALICSCLRVTKQPPKCSVFKSGELFFRNSKLNLPLQHTLKPVQPIVVIKYVTYIKNQIKEFDKWKFYKIWSSNFIIWAGIYSFFMPECNIWIAKWKALCF